MRWLSKKNDSFIVTLSILIASVGGILFLGKKDFGLDEFASVFITQHWSGMWHYLIFNEGNMWLYYVLLYFWSFLGHGAFIVRLLSVFFAVAAIPLVFLLGRRLFGSKVARLAVFLLSIHVFFIQNAHNARAYTLLLFLTSLASYFFVRYVFEGSSKFWFLAVLFDILSVYAHFYALFVILVQFVALFFIKKKLDWRKILVSLPILIVSLLPLFWAPAFHNQPISWIPRPDIRNLIGTFLILSDDFFPIGLISLVLFGWFLIVLWKKRFQFVFSFKIWPHVFIVLWILVPIVTSFLFSVLFKPLYISMYFFICLVPFVFLLSACLDAIGKQWLKNALILLIVVFSLVRLFGWYSADTRLGLVISNTNEDWRGVSTYLGDNVHNRDAILYFPTYIQENVDYYREKKDAFMNEINLQPDAFLGGGPLTPFREGLLLSVPQRFSRVWYVFADYTDSNRADQKMLIERMFRSNYRLVQTKSFAGLVVYLYQR